MLVVITGLQRSGTTVVYELIARNNRAKAIYLYEPFNYGTFKHLQRFRTIIHSELEVTHDYDKVPPYLLKIMRKNSRWIESKKNPLLGKYWLLIIKELIKQFDNVVIKDVFLWIKLEDLLKEDNFADRSKIILTVRPFDDWFAAFKEWFNMQKREFERPFHEKLLKTFIAVRQCGINTISRVKRLPNVISYLIHKDHCPLEFKRLAKELGADLKRFSFDDFSRFLEAMYRKYLELLEKYKSLSNVMIVNLKELQQNPTEVAKDLENFLESKFTLSDVSLVKPI